MQVVILAGGLGLRMRAHAGELPKAMIRVGPAQTPFIGLQLQLLATQGVRDLVICTGSGGDAIEAFVATGSRWGMRVRYSRERPGHLLGTGGALTLAFLRGVLDERFLVLYGDSYLRANLSSIASEFVHQELPAMMAVYRNLNDLEPSNALYRDGRIVLYDKSRRHPASALFQHIDYGITALDRSLIEATLPEGSAEASRFDLSHLQHDLSLTGLLAGYEVSDAFHEIGSPDGLARLEQHLKHQLSHS